MVDANSSLAEIEAAYDNNASYAEDNSVTKAKAFITACRILLRRLYSGQMKGNASLSFRVDLLSEELKQAQQWVELRDADSGPERATFADFTDLRGERGGLWGWPGR